MDLKLVLGKSGTTPRSIRVTCDPDATVGDLAAAIARCDPTGKHVLSGSKLTLAVGAGTGTALEPTLPVDEAALRTGSTVSLVAAQSAPGKQAAAEAVLRVVSGLDAGKEFPLMRGSSLLGRGPECAVRLSDPLVSKVHARIHVGDSVEVFDQNSANGVEVSGELVARIAVKPDDTIIVGETAFAITVKGRQAGVVQSGPAVPFNRPPRVDARFVAESLFAPEPPARPSTSRRISVTAIVLPILMGALLYVITKNIASLAFIALSPVMLIASAIEASFTTKREYKANVAAFRESLAGLAQQIAVEADLERAARCAEMPSTAEFVEGLRRMSPLLWCRRPDQEAFLAVRLGLGTQPSRVSIAMPMARSSDPSLWEELQAVTEPARTVSGVPVVAHLREAGGLGIAGQGERALSVARSLVMQLLLAHSPTDVVVTSIASGASGREWEWLTWAPHVTAAESHLAVAPLASTMPSGVALATALDLLVTARLGETRTPDKPITPCVVVLVADDNPVPRSTLAQLAERGPEAGVHVVWVATDVGSLPAACRAYVNVPEAGPADQAGFVQTGELVEPLAVGTLDRAAADDLARLLAPIVDAGYARAEQDGLPSTVSYLELAGLEVGESPRSIVERWREGGSLPSPTDQPGHRRREGTLRALVGQTATEQTHLDLRLHGPHALVGGTTGSGKSEFLQTWVLGMAAAHSPNRVTFLLVDYKGGSAFADCVRLPHTVGLVTDLSPHLVRRALTSLNAELRYREHILNNKRMKDLVSLERTGDPETPPSLVVVVDEFAALVQEVPEFIDGVVNVAQRGRSLGIHLILATQRPAGVIKDNLRANTNLRVALRVADEADSMDVVGERIAATFDPSLPGRAVVKSGPGRISTFQAAYVGGWTSREPTPARVDVADLTFGPDVPWVEPEVDVASRSQPLGKSDIQRIVDTIDQANRDAGVAAPRKPWLPELATTYDLAALPTKRLDTELVYGVSDDPEAQGQPVAAFYPDRDGSMIVYGTGGAGKSAFLRSIAIASGLTARGGPCQVYGLDFGARGLSSLEVLPHVGSIITGEDEERVARLMRRLRGLIDERARTYAAVNAGTITEYRAIASRPDEPRVILLVDGIGAFRQSYELGQRARWFDMLLSIAADGRPVGVHVVLSADRPGAVPSALSSSLQRRLVLRLANDSDESMLGIRPGVLVPESPPGRGVIDGQEVQVGVLGRDASAPGQASALAQLAESMRRAGVPEAEQIQSLPERIALTELPVEVAGLPALGVSDETLAPIGFPDEGVLLVVGPPRSGRTTVLRSLVASMRRFDRNRKLVYLGNKRSVLRRSLAWDASADTPESIAALAAEITPQLMEESDSSSRTMVVIVIEGLPSFLNTPADMPLQELIKAARNHDHLVICDGDTSEMLSSWPLLSVVKAARTGISLQPDQMDGDTIFRTAFPRVARGEFPPGRGFLVQSGRAVRLQVEVPE